jgi:uncharacterized protein (TIGR03084 family)
VAVDLRQLATDLRAETAELDRVLRELDPEGWEAPTPAAGWRVRDQVSHLAWFDDAATTAALDPARFRSEREAAVADADGFTESLVRDARGLDPSELLAWFSRARSEMVAAYLGLDPATRVPWYGPDFGVASALTARIMETWAHGQDVVDAVGATRAPTGGLRHVAHLGVRTFANSYRTAGLAVPEVEVGVVLDAPGGDAWRWGPDAGVDRVEGDALEFCAVVTRRRRLEDTSLRVSGPVAGAWMRIAQAFAGGAGELRPAGLPPVRTTARAG